jgi:small subunit ribosomal protein S14
MKNKNLKDLKTRTTFKIFELVLIQKKLIVRRLNFLETLNLKVTPCQSNNRCILTARPKAICSDFKLSRIKTRELGLNGLINGFKKVSW